ncbi:MAG: homoserine dehydrogenase, partial [Ferruginibacter sp.]|nr:homoserine dehydrogenase [Ferruginibacter sp.]
VGQGLYFAIENSTGFTTTIKKIVVKNKNKERSLAANYFSFDKNDILEDDDINVVVELIDDADEAFSIVSAAIKKGKHVVTANKKMLGLHMEELLKLKNKYNVSLLYEASACGSIPIIRTLEEYFDNEELDRVSGIFNGTTNYILTKTINEGISYNEALKNAQEKGFAETDATSDVEGFDAMYKTIILALHAFGVTLKHEDLLRFGITTLQPNDILFAKENGFSIKLIPTIKKLAGGKIAAYILPEFLHTENHLSKVDNEFNGVLVEGLISGEQFFMGRGAGSHPTGAAVLSDISALSYGYAYDNKKMHQNDKPAFTNDVAIKVFISSDNKDLLDKIILKNVQKNVEAINYYYKIGEINVGELKGILESDVRKQVFIASI